MANKYLYLHVVQGYYCNGWEDETAEEIYREGRARLREYRENMPEYPHRVIRRRELNPEWLRCGKCGEADKTKGEHGSGRCVSLW